MRVVTAMCNYPACMFGWLSGATWTLMDGLKCSRQQQNTPDWWIHWVFLGTVRETLWHAAGSCGRSTRPESQESHAGSGLCVWAKDLTSTHSHAHDHRTGTEAFRQAGFSSCACWRLYQQFGLSTVTLTPLNQIKTVAMHSRCWKDLRVRTGLMMTS